MPGMSAGMQPGMDPSMDPNIDLEGQVRDGVQAFVQSQDPAIAVEVVNMLAQMMGIAPEIDPFASDAQAPAVEQEIPMARRGMRMYRYGGSLRKKSSVPSYPGGGKGPDPNDPSSDPNASAGMTIDERLQQLNNQAAAQANRRYQADLDAALAIQKRILEQTQGVDPSDPGYLTGDNPYATGSVRRSVTPDMADIELQRVKTLKSSGYYDPKPPVVGILGDAPKPISEGARMRAIRRDAKRRAKSGSKQARASKRRLR